MQSALRREDAVPRVVGNRRIPVSKNVQEALKMEAVLGGLVEPVDSDFVRLGIVLRIDDTRARDKESIQAAIANRQIAVWKNINARNREFSDAQVTQLLNLTRNTLDAWILNDFKIPLSFIMDVFDWADEKPLVFLEAFLREVLDMHMFELVVDDETVDMTEERERILYAWQNRNAFLVKYIADRADTRGKFSLDEISYAIEYSRGYEESSKFHLANGLVTKRDSIGNTLIMWAARTKRQYAVDFLLNTYPHQLDDINKHGDSILMLIIGNSTYADIRPTIQTLLANKVDVNIQNADGDTALIIAARSNKLQTVEYLLAVDGVYMKDITEVINGVEVTRSVPEIDRTVRIKINAHNIRRKNALSSIFHSFENTFVLRIIKSLLEHPDYVKIGFLGDKDRERDFVINVVDRHFTSNNDSQDIRDIRIDRLGTEQRIEVMVMLINHGRIMAQGKTIGLIDKLWSRTMNVGQILERVRGKVPFINLVSDDGNDYTLLYRAVWLKNRDVVKLLIALGADTSIVTTNGRTPLFRAVLTKMLNMVKVFIDAGANLNIANKEGSTPLHEAVYLQRLDIVRALIGAGANVNTIKTDQYGRTPLMTSANKGDVGITEALLGAGADMSVLSTGSRCGKTALFYAINRNYENHVQLQAGPGVDLAIIRTNNEKLVRILIDAGADLNIIIDIRPNIKKTYLSYAVNNNIENIVKILLDAGADVSIPNSFGVTPLVRAVKNENEVIVKLLLEKGANVNNLDTGGYSPLEYAIHTRNGAIIQILVDAGAVLRQDTSSFYLDEIVSYNTPLGYAIRKKNVLLVKILVDAGADVNVANTRGETPLLLIINDNYFRYRVEHDAIFVILVEAGADLTILDWKGASVLLNALKYRSAKAIRVLIEAGVVIEYTASFKAELEKHDVMHRFFDKNYTEDDEYILQIFIDAGLDMNTAYSHGETPLLLSIRTTNGSITKMLIDNGADVNKANLRSVTPLMTAIGRNIVAVIKILLDNNADMYFVSTFKVYKGKTVFEIAVASGNIAIVKEFIAHGVRLDGSALIIAAERGKKEIVKALIDAGANVTRDNNRALMAALENNKPQSVDLLIEQDALRNTLSDELIASTPRLKAALERYEKRQARKRGKKRKETGLKLNTILDNTQHAFTQQFSALCL